MRLRTAAYAVVPALALAGVALVVTSPARAAAYGTLTITPTTGGSVTANPMFTSAVTSKACPAGYGDNVQLQIGKVGAVTNGSTGSEFFNLAPILTAGGYDTGGPITLAPNRSFLRGLTGADTGTVADGDYEISVVCLSEANGDYVDHFYSPKIKVTSGTWEFVAPPAGSPSASEPSTSPSGSPSPTPTDPVPTPSATTTATGGVVVTVSGTPVPTTPAPTTTGEPTTDPTEAPTDAPGGDGGSSDSGSHLPVTGLALGGLLAAGALLVGGGAGVRRLSALRRRRQVGA